MKKIKKNDIVLIRQIRRSSGISRRQDLVYTECQKYIGKTARVTHVRYISDDVSQYNLDIDDGEYVWFDDEITPVSQMSIFIKEEKINA